MALFNGRTIITMPAGLVPADVQYTRNNVVAVSESIFTGQQQIQDWGGSWLEAVLTFTSRSATQGVILRDFLISLNGQSNVFAFAGTNLLASIPSTVTFSGYWCLKNNNIGWGIKPGLIYGFKTVELREAK